MTRDSELIQPHDNNEDVSQGYKSVSRSKTVASALPRGLPLPLPLTLSSHMMNSISSRGAPHMRSEVDSSGRHARIVTFHSHHHAQHRITSVTARRVPIYPLR